MALRFEDSIMQKDPGAPLNPPHSFDTWSAPLRGDAAKLVTAVLALGLVGTPAPSAHPTATDALAQRHAMTTNFIHTPSASPPVFVVPPMPVALTALENVAYRRSRKGALQRVSRTRAEPV